MQYSMEYQSPSCTEKNKIKHSFNKEKKQDGQEFVAGFLKRQKIISLRKPEGVHVLV